MMKIVCLFLTSKWIVRVDMEFNLLVNGGNQSRFGAKMNSVVKL